MIQTKYTFISEEAHIALPKQGKYDYAIESSFPINYSRNILGSLKREISVKIQSDENQPYIRLISINVRNTYFRFSDGSYAMKDILKKIASIYNNLVLRVSYIGKVMAIDNMLELQEVWNNIKKYVQHRYKGNQVEELILNMDEILSSERKLIDEISLYQNFGGLLKPLYSEYITDKITSISQELNTRYGKIIATEEISLQSSRNVGEIALKVKANHPENEEYLTIDGLYSFKRPTDFWLQNAVISIVEKYGRQEYQSIYTLKQL
ncbi:hypothetical protein [uncultured Aquimarina sp.]|uniref:hypothetical protein n=1 Tax=uncultured Aquimarina sp. TaxID=575652 RepID=UPI002604BD64|nr:hypothetical protein [uncultured Aquimarina sp.]